ncbi:MAG: hypothetical protein EBZ59_08525 [Planctomycetia bacterium]|nr:hypothetical protein [Planctomycetia bacterium]
MSVRIVTGYVRLDAHRSHADYVALGGRLLSLPFPMTVFTDQADEFPQHVNHEFLPAGKLWLEEYAAGRDVTIPATDNPTKDTLQYHCVQHQKTAWLARAAEAHPDDVLVWLDLGILHVPGITLAGISRAVGLAEGLRRDRIRMASIWGAPPRDGIDSTRINWWCAGGLVVCPAPLAAWWHDCVSLTARDLAVRCGRVTFEVNTWAAVWAAFPDCFDHYPCDHNATLLDIA